MAVSFSDLTQRLATDVPGVGGSPTPEQYGRFIVRAVDDWNRRVGRRCTTLLQLVAGQASYEMPADMLGVIRMDWPRAADGDVLVTGAGLVPLSDPGRFRWDYTFEDGRLTLVPAPSWSGAVRIWYRGGQVVEDDAYPHMTEEIAEIVLLKARAIALRFIAGLSATSHEIAEYRFGDVTVKRANMSETLQKEADKLDGAGGEYLSAIKAFIGVHATRQRIALSDVPGHYQL